MPFDGRQRRGFSRPDDKMLHMVELALDGGANSIQGTRQDYNKRCLVTRVIHLQKRRSCSHLLAYLAEAIRERIQTGYEGLSDYQLIGKYNDAKTTKFSDIVDVIREARELARADERVRVMETRARRTPTSRTASAPETAARSAP